ncbi:hypothetical protein K8O92_20230 [Nocardia asteroides]|nr:hypothetical protein K8O92_20230 [Nocardia asteroides]
MLVGDCFGCVALVLLQIDDPGGIGVLSDRVQRCALTEERDDVVADVGQVPAAAVVLDTGQTVDVLGQPLDQQHRAELGFLFGLDDLQRLIDPDTVDQARPPLGLGVVIEGLRGLPAGAVGVVVVEGDLPVEGLMTWAAFPAAERGVDPSARPPGKALVSDLSVTPAGSQHVDTFHDRT